MFNSYSVSSQNITKVNAVSGMLQKQYKESFIIRFDKDSNYENQIFSLNPKIILQKEERVGEAILRHEKSREVVVLQVMLAVDNSYIVELMWKDDFEKLFSLEGCGNNDKQRNNK